MSQSLYRSISLISESREENRRSEEAENVKADAKRKIRKQDERKVDHFVLAGALQNYGTWEKTTRLEVWLCVTNNRRIFSYSMVLWGFSNFPDTPLTSNCWPH